MTSSELSAALRKIASGIESSKNPDRNLVARDIHKVLTAISQETPSIETVVLTPDQAAQAIQNVANKLAASKNPDPNKVIDDIKKIISAL